MRAETKNLRTVAAPLAGAILLLGLAFAALPRLTPLRAPETPFDHTPPELMAQGFALLSRAGEVIPNGASVVARGEPPDPTADTYLHHVAVALLPRRRVLPAAVWGVAAPELAREAEYLVVLGKPPFPPPGDLLLRTRAGTVWRRRA